MRAILAAVKAALIVAAVALIAATVLWVGEGPRAPRGRRAAIKAAEAGATLGKAAPGLPAAKATDAPPAEPCVDPLGAFHAAVAARDADGLGLAADNLAEWIGDDEGRALRVVEAFRSEGELASLDLLAFALAGSAGGAGSQAVAREMLSTASGDGCPARRGAALLFLARSGARSAEVERAGLWIAQRDEDPLARAAAFDLLKGIASSDSAAAGRLAPSLLVEASRGEDPAVRIAALSAVAARGATEEVLRGIGDRLAADPDPAVRMEAVARLTDASPGERPLVVDLLRAGIERERDLDVRRACAEGIARIGGAAAASVLEGLSERDPDLAREIAGLAAVLRTGETDWQRIREELARRSLSGPQVPSGNDR